MLKTKYKEKSEVISVLNKDDPVIYNFTRILV